MSYTSVFLANSYSLQIQIKLLLCCEAFMFLLRRFISASVLALCFSTETSVTLCCLCYPLPVSPPDSF